MEWKSDILTKPKLRTFIKFKDSPDIVTPKNTLPHRENVDIIPLAKDLPSDLQFVTWNI